MPTRLLTLATLTAVCASTLIVGAQEPQGTERLGRCITPVSTTGVYFEVTADGSTERILRMTPESPRQKVTHSQVHVTAVSRVRVPPPEPHIDGELWTRQTSGRMHPPPIHAVRLRGSGETPTLLTPQRVVGATPARTHRHESVFNLPIVGVDGGTLHAVIDSAVGTTGCRLRLRHVVR